MKPQRIPRKPDNASVEEAAGNAGNLLSGAGGAIGGAIGATKALKSARKGGLVGAATGAAAGAVVGGTLGYLGNRIVSRKRIQPRSKNLSTPMNISNSRLVALSANLDEKLATVGFVAKRDDQDENGLLKTGAAVAGAGALGAGALYARGRYGMSGGGTMGGLKPGLVSGAGKIGVLDTIKGGAGLLKQDVKGVGSAIANSTKSLRKRIGMSALDRLVELAEKKEDKTSTGKKVAIGAAGLAAGAAGAAYLRGRAATGITSRNPRSVADTMVAGGRALKGDARQAVNAAKSGAQAAGKQIAKTTAGARKAVMSKIPMRKK